MVEETTFLPHQIRVIDEKRALDENLQKLRAFFGTGVFNALETAEQERLHRQATYMTLYSGVLGERIDAF